MNDIVEIRWHGRGGQGAKPASLLLADAAFNTGKYVQSFPEYGPERMGAPITAYNRISTERSTVHSNIYFPDYVVVVDETLLHSVDVTAGLKKEGAIVVNSGKTPAQLRPQLKGYEGKVCTIVYCSPIVICPIISKITVFNSVFCLASNPDCTTIIGLVICTGSVVMSVDNIEIS